MSRLFSLYYREFFADRLKVFRGRKDFLNLEMLKNLISKDIKDVFAFKQNMLKAYIHMNLDLYGCGGLREYQEGRGERG